MTLRPQKAPDSHQGGGSAREAAPGVCNRDLAISKSTWTSTVAKIMDPILPILSILGYWAIVLGSLEVQVLVMVVEPGRLKAGKLDQLQACVLCRCAHSAGE